MITIIGIFNDPALADDALTYLLANDFIQENIDIFSADTDIGGADRIGHFFSHILENEKEATHYASIGRQGSIVTVHAISTREAEEAVDVFNTYGAVEINEKSSRVVERVVDEDKRLR